MFSLDFEMDRETIANVLSSKARNAKKILATAICVYDIQIPSV